MATELVNDLAGSNPPKAAVLLIVGEPFSDGDKQLILEEIVKGFKCWNSAATGVDINDELATIANRADLGEEGPEGERIIRHRSENSVVDLLINPQAQTVKESLKVVLSLQSAAKLIIYAGYAFQGNAAWVVQDELFSFSTFNQVFKDANVENALKQIEGGATLMLHTPSPADWTSALKGSDVDRLLKVSINPKPHLDHVHGVVQFTAYVGNLIRVLPLGSMLQASDVIGNISFTRPVLYIFPGQHGDAALFGMKGFNMLINGGYSRHSCFWDFVRHLDGIDALLMTHLGPDNLFGIKALLERKVTDTIHPDIDYMYMNTSKPANGVKAIEEGRERSPGLIINLASEGNRLLELSRKLGHSPHPLTRPLSGNLEPINLFHKVGKGSLDMYVLNPVGDAKEMKDFLAQWGKEASSFTQANGIPIPNCTSISALLVVRPASPMENVTRILFPGSAPQHKLLEGLERVKHLEFLKHPTFCTQDLQKPKKPPSAAGGRPTSGLSKPASAASSRSATNAKNETFTASRSSSKPEPPKRLEMKSSASKVSSAPASKAAKTQKETNNKRATSAKDKEKVKLDEKEKEDKSKSSSSSSPSKASVKTASPVKTPTTPAKAPTPASPSQAPEAAVLTQPLVPEPEPVPQEQEPSPVSPQANHVDQGLPPADVMQQPPANADFMMAGDNRLMGTAPEALPQPSQFESSVDSALQQQQQASAALSEQERLRELGIYDDDDEGVDDGFDDRENESEFGAQPQSLPEPPAAVERPSGPGPDLIQDAPCQPSSMVQSQIFDQEIKPDYTAEAENTPPPADDGLGAAEEESGSPEPEPENVKEQSPAPTPEDSKDFSPSFSDKEQTPDSPQKEMSPALEEPSFTDDPVESQSGNNIAQNIQYGMPMDNGFQMGGIREEEEEEAAAEREDLEKDQPDSMNKQSMEDMGIYDDDEGQDEDDGKDAYAYENDGNLEDEEIRMAGSPSGQVFGQHAEEAPQGLAEQDLQSSYIPEAFERDDSPTHMEKQLETGGQADSGQEDTDSIDGGTPDHDKDIDEALAMQQQKQDALEELMTGEQTGLGDGQPINPFIGLGAQNLEGAAQLGEKQLSPFEPDELNDVQQRGGPEDFDPLEQRGGPAEFEPLEQRGGPAEFDPLAKWGPPTGLPAPSPLMKDVEQEQGASQQQEAEGGNLLHDEAVAEQEENNGEDHFKGQHFEDQGFGLEGGENAEKASSDKGSEADPSEFDPLAAWGQPMGLPAPPPAESSSKTSAKPCAGDAKKPEAKKPGASPMKGKTGADKKPGSATGKSPAKPANGTSEPPKSARPKPDAKKGGLDTSRSARPASGKTLDSSRVEPKARPASSTTAAARKPASASKPRASPDVVKMPPLPPFTPFYMDLTYIPNHGDISYVDAEFFKRVRARYYVLSARNPNPKVLEMLMDAKATWDKANSQEVTVIPTYETQILQHWMAVHKEKLAENKIDIAPAASRCTVRLQDHEDSCYTYRLEF
ncbi:hypothetical protein ACOMHN_048068 [Nucella lapillus]